MRRFLSLLVLTSSVLLAACGKPVITEECVMNGMGEGTCSFTNTGAADGSMCGTVIVVKSADKSPNGRSERSESSTFCSGNISPDSTSQISFNVPRISEMCSVYNRPWNETCDFAFSSSSGSGAGWMQNLLILVLFIVAGGLIWRYFPMLKGLYKKNSRKCPFCAESVKPQAIICKSCGKDIHEQVPEQNSTEKFEGKSAELTVEGKNLFAAKLGEIRFWWKQQLLGGKLIAASLFMAIASMFMNWAIVIFSISSQFPLGISVSVYDFLVFAGCWLYPVFVILKNKSMKLLFGIAAPTVSLLWTFYVLYDHHSTKIFFEENGYGTREIGFGLWFYILASIVLFVGVALHEPSQDESLETNAVQ